MVRPLLIVLAACSLFEAGWSLTTLSHDSQTSSNDNLTLSNDNMTLSNDNMTLSNDSLPSPEDSLNPSNDTRDQVQVKSVNAGKTKTDNEWTARFLNSHPCNSVGYNYRCFSCQSVTCEGQNTFLYCGPGEVLDIRSAVYGRRETQICSQNRPWSQISNTNCGVHSSKVAHICNGKRTCSIRADNNMFGDPCYGTYKYLMVTYSCQRQSVTCEGHTTSLSCDPGKVLSIFSTVYGRQDTRTCSQGRPWSQIANTRCATCTTTRVAQICDGRRFCSFQAVNSLFGDPCYGTYKYLTVTYTCD